MAAVTKTISGKYITTCGHTDRPMEDFEIAPEEVELYRLDRVTFEKLCNDGTIDFDSTLARAQRDNNIYNNSPSPKGTGIDNNSNNNSKKNVPKKGGGRWQSGDGKKMIDEFLDWVDKDSISSDLKALARKVWDNKAHKDFVAKQIDPRKGYAASNDAFENKFYPACMRAIREREKQRCNAAKAREQSRDALANEELQNCKLHGEYAILTAK